MEDIIINILQNLDEKNKKIEELNNTIKIFMRGFDSYDDIINFHKDLIKIKELENNKLIKENAFLELEIEYLKYKLENN